MSTAKVLVCDDEVSLSKALERFLKDAGYYVRTALSFDAALAAVREESFDLALVDLKLGESSGLELLSVLKKTQPEIIPIILTGYGTIDSAVTAIKQGAYQYLTKPFHLENLKNLIEQALEFHRVKKENRSSKHQVQSRIGAKQMIGVSEPMQEIYSIVQKVADTDSTVLILGESGTGKELIARAIHQASSRCEKPMVTVNCGAIPEELLESELFGHAKGAFTGAVSSRSGRFEMASSGTIFLDEIGEMSPKLQVKLLRVLQERKFEPVGSNHTVEVNVRIIAATNRYLEEEVKQHRFREDLYYRLNVIPIQMPPLRDRPSDIPLLVNHFFQGFAAEYHREVPALSEEAMELLTRYSWPGNVRELENMAERLMILKKNGSILASEVRQLLNLTDELPAVTPNKTEKVALNLKETVDQFENQLILKALEQTRWNKNQAAQLLGLNRTTLVEKMKKRGLAPHDTSLC